MQNAYSHYLGFTLAFGTLLATAGAARAQAPVITAVAPAANVSAAARTSPVIFSFSQPLTTGSAAALKVYSAQRGGLRTRGATPAQVSGNTLRFTPTAYPFLPGETVVSTVTTAAASSSAPLPHARVVQFTAATGGTGRGNFLAGTDPAASAYAFSVVVGDVDGDGDLDLLTADQGGNTVRIQLNGGDNSGSNTGVFSNGSTVTVEYTPYNLVLGDVDGDGDLDLVAAGYGGTARVAVRLNGGDATGSDTGVFSNGSMVAVVGQSYSVALGDVDGDGDLDLLSAPNAFKGEVSVRLNGGDATGSNTGAFSSGSTVAVNDGAYSIVVGDVDGDGDLDLLTSHLSNGRVSVRLNGGDATGSNTGVFSQGSDVLLQEGPYGLTLGDVDGDGDLDLLTANVGANSVSVRLNGGDATGSNTGTFRNGSEVAVPGYPVSVALGDVDGDGDLDFVTANYMNNTASVRLNGGDATGSNTGTFRSGASVAVGNKPYGVALGDVDGDGDVDLLTANQGTASVRLNQPTQVLATLGSGTILPTSFVVTPTVATAGAAPQYTYTGQALPASTTLALYSLSGQRIWQQTAAVAASGPLPVAGLASGWYIVRLLTASDSYLSRFYQP